MNFNWSAYPEDVEGATGNLVGETFLSCGGGQDNKATSDKCYKQGSTTPFAALRTKRRYAASAVVEGKLWVTGGEDANGDQLKLTEFVDPNCGTVQLGPNLPVESSAHCVVIIDSTKAFLIGGCCGYTRTKDNTWFYTPRTAMKTGNWPSLKNKNWIYNFNSPERGWAPGPMLNEGRLGHVCGVIQDSGNDEKKLVIAAGGYNRKSTEILVVGSQPERWTRGPDLPARISGAAGVTTPDGKTFLFVGGWNWDTGRLEDSIYKLQCYNLECCWTKLDHRLKVARSSFLAAFVPDSVLLQSELV